MRVAVVGAGLAGLAAARELVTGASFGGADHDAVFARGVWAARRVASAFAGVPR